MAAHNADPRRPHQVGFARALATPLSLTIQPDRLVGAIGDRVGGGFLSRDRSGSWIWGTSVEVEGARALRLELSEVDLPAGARFWVYGADGEARSFDLRRLAAGRTLFSPVIEGDRIHLEVELPDGALASGQGFEIRRVHELVRSRGTLQTFASEADSCLQNGECFDASDFPGIEIARDGVVQYFFTSGGSTYVCSAGLLNDNVASTLEPWLLTANHCVSTQSEALSIDSAFFYRYNSCGGGGSTYSLGPQGADLIVTSESTDVTLLRATDADEIPPGAYYLGWTSIRPADGTMLHRLSHPVRESDSTLLPQIYSSHQLDETPAFVCSGAPATHFLHSLNTGGTGVHIDARPSDAIALALRVRAPILVSKTVLDNAPAVTIGDDTPTPVTVLKHYGLTLQNLTAPLAAHFHLPTTEGVLVSDVEVGSGADRDGLRRGDVIAKAGQTGSVDAPQLHFELRKGATAVDPLKYLSSAQAAID